MATPEHAYLGWNVKSEGIDFVLRKYQSSKGGGTQRLVSDTSQCQRSEEEDICETHAFIRNITGKMNLLDI